LDGLAFGLCLLWIKLWLSSAVPDPLVVDVPLSFKLEMILLSLLDEMEANTLKMLGLQRLSPFTWWE
jgi:hypothetical protein